MRDEAERLEKRRAKLLEVLVKLYADSFEFHGDLLPHHNCGWCAAKQIIREEAQAND